MKVQQLNINEFLSTSDTQFVIPVYQRNYDWEKEQCKQLWDDIIEIAENENSAFHFIGSIVYVYDDTNTAEGKKERTIIDGQQRLTTLILLYMAIFNQLDGEDNEREKRRIQEEFLTNPHLHEEEKLKLKATENNHEAIQYLLANNRIENYSKYSKIIENYDFFSGKLKEENYKTILKGIGKLTFVEIGLKRGEDNPQEIFESINSTGLNLSQSDLVRNYVLIGLDPKTQEKFFNKYWKIIEENTIKEDNNSKLTAEFIRDFLTIESKSKKVPPKNKVHQFFKIHQSSQNKHKVKSDSVKKTLENLKEYSYHYSKLLNPSKEKDKKVRQHLEWINEIEVGVAYPFLIRIYSDYTKKIIKKREFIEVLELVQNYVWRRFLANIPTNGLNKVFPSLYGAPKHEKLSYIENLQAYLLSRGGSGQFPKDEKIKNSLESKDIYHINSKNKHYLFEKLEKYNNKEYVDNKDNKDITIEHIFPQSHENKWKRVLKKDGIKKMKEKIHTIGNLTQSGNNSSLSNKYFTDKRDMPERKGYRYSPLWINKSLKKLEKWDYEEWKKRTTKLAKRINEVWPYPPNKLLIKLEKINQKQEYDIVDLKDVRNKKIKSIRFLDDFHPINKWTEVYSFIVKKICELTPEKFDNEIFRDNHQIKISKEELRDPQKIGSNYYIETHGDSNNLLSKIKKILESCDLEDELQITLNK